MLLRLLVVVDAHEEYVAGVVGYLRGIFLALDLVDGSFFYYFTYIYYLVSCHSSHILAFFPQWLGYLLIDNPASGHGAESHIFIKFL